MRTHEIGQAIRNARHSRNLTQATLAATAGLSRETLNLLESGLVRDLGIRKVLAVLEALDLDMAVEPTGKPRRPDYLRMACTSANVSFKTALTEDELVHAIVTGKVPQGKAAHLRALVDEAPLKVLKGLGEAAGKWVQPGKLERNLTKIVHDSGASRKIEEWLTID
ncbi:MAG: helix-turn-helix domain-containing protein [Betaproteobacteria bacterium]|nr:helix-turn-helix domain-containing protein [Betaproteobacteria bacterium]